MQKLAMRLALMTSLMALAVGYVWLQGISEAITSSAPTGCMSGSPAVMQGVVGAKDPDEVAEIVTGWHEYTRQSRGSASMTSADLCVSVMPPQGESTDVRVRSGLDVAHSWITLDMVLFTPAYGAALVAILVYAGWTTAFADRDRNALLHALQSAVRWRPSKRWTSQKRVSPIWIWLVVAGCLMDELENRAMREHLDQWWTRLDSTGSLTLGANDLAAIHTFSALKWSVLALPLALVVLVAIHAIATAAGALFRALRVLWLQLVAALLFVLLARIDQGADAVRRLSLTQWFVTVGIVLAFGVVLVLAAGEFLKPRQDEHPREPDCQQRYRFVFQVGPAIIVVAIGAVTVGVGCLARRPGLTLLGGMLVGIGLLSVVIDIGTLLQDRRHRERAVPPTSAPSRPQPKVLPVPERDDLAKVACCLIGVVLAGFGLATVAATVGDLAVLTHLRQPLEERMVVGVVVAVLAGPLVLATRALVGRRDRWTNEWAKVAVLAAAVVVLVVLGAILQSPSGALSFAPTLGTLGVVAIFLATLCLVGSVAAQVSYRLSRSIVYGERLAVPSFLRSIGFSGAHSPIVGLLVVWALAVTVVDYSDYYAVRQTPKVADRAAPLTVSAAVTKWSAHDPSPDESRPILFVAAAGGGIRAAYWTAAVMSCVVEMRSVGDDPCGSVESDPDVLNARRRSLFGLSGASGGSLGLTEYVASVGDQWGVDDETARASARSVGLQWVDDRLGPDFLAAGLATYVFNDALNALLRPDNGVDRASILERSWEAAWPNGSMMGQGFFANQNTGDEPYLMLNGTSVQDGCRVLTSPILTQIATDARNCDRSGPPRGTAGVDAAPSTIDLVHQLCATCDIRFSTAALTSARFPLVTPAGRLLSATGGSPIDVVDGGYRENSGASTIVDLWPEVQQALADPTTKSPCVRPIFLQIDNGYSDDDEGPREATGLNQLLVPAIADLHIGNGVEKAARQASQHLFDGSSPGGTWFRVTTVAHPGSSAPLGWVLSTDARQDLIDQLRVNRTVIEALRAQLDATVLC